MYQLINRYLQSYPDAHWFRFEFLGLKAPENDGKHFTGDEL